MLLNRRCPACKRERMHRKGNVDCCVCVYVCVCVCMYVCMYVYYRRKDAWFMIKSCVLLRTPICIHVHSRTYIHVHSMHPFPLIVKITHTPKVFTHRIFFFLDQLLVIFSRICSAINRPVLVVCEGRTPSCICPPPCMCMCG